MADSPGGRSRMGHRFPPQPGAGRCAGGWEKSLRCGAPCTWAASWATKCSPSDSPAGACAPGWRPPGGPLVPPVGARRGRGLREHRDPDPVGVPVRVPQHRHLGRARKVRGLSATPVAGVGLTRVRELVIGVPEPETRIDRWRRLLEPARAAEPGRCVFPGGPAIRFEQSPRLSQRLIREVRARWTRPPRSCARRSA